MSDAIKEGVDVFAGTDGNKQSRFSFCHFMFVSTVDPFDKLQIIYNKYSTYCPALSV